jgi:hypothetical protein
MTLYDTFKPDFDRLDLTAEAVDTLLRKIISVSYAKGYADGTQSLSVHGPQGRGKSGSQPEAGDSGRIHNPVDDSGDCLAQADS